MTLSTEETLTAFAEWLDGSEHLDLDAPIVATLVADFLAAYTDDLLAGQLPNPCPGCLGRGLTFEGDACPTCGGSGVKPTTPPTRAAARAAVIRRQGS